MAPMFGTRITMRHTASTLLGMAQFAITPMESERYVAES